MKILLLFYMLIFLPGMALRTAHRLSALRRELAEGALSSPPFLVLSLLVQGVLLLLSVAAGREIGFSIFSFPPLSWVLGLATLTGLAACLGLLPVARWMHSIEERRRMIVHYLLPRSSAEKALWAATILAAGIAEEAAYRGVGVALLAEFLGSFWLAAGVSALAFATAHAVQGLKSGVVVFFIALVLQSLVVFTGSLLPAMLVHAVLDYIAVGFIGTEARRLGLAR